MITEHGRSACTSILIGKKASISGSVIIDRNEDCKTAWPKYLRLNPATICAHNHFSSNGNKFETDLPDRSYAYSSTPEWTDKYGIFEEDGINEYRVTVSATKSAYANGRILAVNPFDIEEGILEETMVTYALPYVKTAREGVERLDEIVTEHGAAEADDILFADPDEAWYLEIGSGHHYVTQRVPDDSYAVISNQLAIQEVDFTDYLSFTFPPDLPGLVYQNKLWPKDKPFNFREISRTQDDSDLHYNAPRMWAGQKLLTPSKKKEPRDFYLLFLKKPDRPITIQDAQRVLRDHYQNTPFDLTNKKGSSSVAFRPISVATTQEGHLLRLSGGSMTQWLCMGITSQGVYVPLYPQGAKTPAMWDKEIETYSNDSAHWIFKLASVLADRDWDEYGKDLLTTQGNTSKELIQIRHEYDQKLLAVSDCEREVELIDEANEEMANLAVKNY